jgi:hypothetical protein
MFQIYLLHGSCLGLVFCLPAAAAIHRVFEFLRIASVTLCSTAALMDGSCSREKNSTMHQRCSAASSRHNGFVGLYVSF